MVTALQLPMTGITDDTRCPHCRSMCWVADRSGDGRGVRCGMCARTPNEARLLAIAATVPLIDDCSWPNQFNGYVADIERDRKHPGTIIVEPSGITDKSRRNMIDAQRRRRQRERRIEQVAKAEQIPLSTLQRALKALA